MLKEIWAPSFFVTSHGHHLVVAVVGMSRVTSGGGGVEVTSLIMIPKAPRRDPKMMTT